MRYYILIYILVTMLQQEQHCNILSYIYKYISTFCTCCINTYVYIKFIIIVVVGGVAIVDFVIFYYITKI